MEPLRKPHEICAYSPELENLDEAAFYPFIDSQKKKIQGQLWQHGLRIRFAKKADVFVLKNLIDEYFTPQAASQLSLYDVYNAWRYGYSIVVEDMKQRFAGAKFSLSYVTPERISHSFVAIVKEGWRGHDIGALSSRYSCLLGMERGGKTRVATCHPQNHPSLWNLLNRVGYVVKEFHADLFGDGEPRMYLSFPLTPAGWANNVIDMDKVGSYMEAGKPGTDYKVVPTTDWEQIGQVYAQKRFRIVALLPGEMAQDGIPAFLAVPRRKMS